MVAENAYDAMFLLLRLWVVTAVAFAVLYGLFVSNQDVQLQLLTAQLLILMMSPAIMAALFQMRRRRNRTDGPGR
jgi:Na+/proline symporter